MARGPHGHARKLDRIMFELKAEGSLPDALRPVVLEIPPEPRPQRLRAACQAARLGPRIGSKAV
jgi:hypothetical protein